VLTANRLRLLGQLAVLTASRLLVNTGLRMVYPFLPELSRGLNVTLVEMASLVSLRNFAGLLGPVFSPLSERRGRRPVLVLAMLLFAAGCLVVFFWPSYWFFGLALAAVSVAKVIFDPAMQAFLGDNVDYRQRGKAISITEMSWAGAFFLGVPAAGLAIQRFGWSAPFLALGLLGLVGAALIARVIPAADNRRQHVTSLGQTWRVIRRRRVIWAAAMYILLVMAANELILIVFGGWMEGSFGLTLGALGLASSVIGGAEVTGELLTGLAVDHFGKRPIVIGTGLLAAAMYFLIPRTSGSLTAALASLFLLFLFFEMAVVGGVPLMTELVPHARGVVMSVVLAAAGVGRALGALAGPPLWSGLGFRALGAIAAVVMLAAVVILARWLREGVDEGALPAISAGRAEAPGAAPEA
jgi:predicted MFS family arabinose efflux permease